MKFFGANAVRSMVSFGLIVVAGVLFPTSGKATETLSGAKTPPAAKQSKKVPQRIVSLNGSNTEILFALGVGDQIVGVDTSGQTVPGAEKIANIGYQYQVSAEGVLGLNPTLIIGKPEVKPESAIQQFRATGIRVELLKEAVNFEEARQHVLQLGKLVNREEKAKELVAQLNEDIKRFEARKKELGDKLKKKVLFVYLRGPSVVFALGKDTGPGHLIDIVGAQNALPDTERQVPITPEALVSSAPEVLVTFAHGLDSIGGVKGLLTMPGVNLTPAGKNERVVSMDDLYLGVLTHRAGRAALDLLNAIHGEGFIEVKESK